MSGFGFRDAVELPVEAQVLADTHALGERQVAGREPDALRGPAALVREVESADRHRTLVGRDDTEDHEQRRGLARAVRAEERDPLAGVHDEVDTVDRPVAAVVLDEAASFEHHFDGHAPNGTFWACRTRR